MTGDLLTPSRTDEIVVDKLMTKLFAEFLDNSTELLNHFQVGDGDPIGSLVATRKMIFLRQDGGSGTTLYLNEVGDGTTSGWRAV